MSDKHMNLTAVTPAQQYLDITQTLMVALDVEGRVTLLNRAGCELLGYTSAEFLGRNWFETCLPQPEGKEGVLPVFRRIMAGELANFEFFENEVVCRDGTRRLIRWHNTEMRDDAGRIVGILSSGEDITERKMAEEESRYKEKKYRAFITKTTEGVWCWDVDEPFSIDLPEDEQLRLVMQGRISEANDAAARQYGLSRGEEMIGRSFREFIDEEIFIGLCNLLVAACFSVSNVESEEMDVAGNRHYFINNSVGIIEDRRLVRIWGTQREITELKLAEEKLRIFKESVENSFDAVGMSTPEGTHYYQNRAFDELFGPVGANPQNTVFVDPAVGHEVFQEIMAGKQWTGDVQMYAKDRRILDIFLRAYANKDESGRITALVGIHTDISERKHSEEELRQNRNMLDQVLNTVPQSVFWKDRDSRYLGCNMQFARAVGFENPDKIVGKTDFDLPWPREEAEAYRSDDRFVMDHNLPKSHIIEPLQQAGGSRIWIDTMKTPLVDSQNMVYGVLGVYEDITERKRAQEELARATAMLQAAIEQTPAGILIADAPDVTIRLVNPAALGIRGESAEALTDIPAALHPARWLTFWPNGTPVGPEDLPLSRAILKGETVQNEEVVICRSNGESRHVLANAAPVRNDLGEVVAGVVVFMDITEIKQAELEREKLQAQLVQAQKMESVGRLAGGVAHDFNNMLGVILGHVELTLADLVPSEPLYASLEEIRKAAQRSADLTRQLLAFARKQTVEPRVLVLNEIVENVLRLLRRLIGEGIDLAWMPGGDLWPVRMDPSQVDQILVNLCINASDAIAGVGKVTIETGNANLDEDYCAQHAGFFPGNYVMLAVSDDGCGMDAETRSQIFEPFFTTKEVGQGTGLGLATVYGAVKQNNGFVNVYSEPGQGTTFKIYLPRHAAKAAGEAKAPKTQAVARGSETILLVEDEPAILKMTTMMLEKLGYNVLAAHTPGEAIRLALEHSGHIDLLMTDVVMPEMNGRDLAKNLLAIYPDIRRLFMSGYTANVIAHQGVLDPGVHFLQKPFSTIDLGAKIREALSSEE